MFGRFPVQVLSRCEGLNEEHSIAVHGGQTHFSTSWHAKMSLATTEAI